jgi:pescadillo protein
MVKLKRSTKRRGEGGLFYTRSEACRKLQLKLKDFRRLCILKGIYPREPKKKFKGTNKTYYHVKDIKFLENDKILQTLRDLKIFTRRYNRLVNRGEDGLAEDMLARKPVMEFQHIIKERYPTFVDALKDLDDSLCMIFLYASFTTTKFVSNEWTQLCQRLAYEFMLYCTVTQCFKKVFLSIKGIYYQVEIMGVDITWIVPYQFTQDKPLNVDYKVMNRFLHFYSSLVKFVNFKLYTDIGFTYPPTRMDLESEDGSKIQLSKVKEMQEQAAAKLYGQEEEDKQDISEEFKNSREYQLIREREKKQEKRRKLFQK